jgi:hypothetical protein
MCGETLQIKFGKAHELAVPQSTARHLASVGARIFLLRELIVASSCIYAVEIENIRFMSAVT